MPRKKVYESDDPKQRRLNAVDSYKKKNSLKRLAVDLPEGKINEIKAFAAAHGLSMAGLISRSISWYMTHFDEIEN